MIGHYGASHHFHVTRLSSELAKINWAHSIRGIGVSIIAVFVPIYLLNLGNPLPKVIFYHLLCGVSWLFFIYPAYRLLFKVGGNLLMAIGSILTIIQLGVLLTIPAFGWPLWLPALLWGAAAAPYWYAFRVNFASGINLEKTGKEVGLSAALYLAACGVAPAIGGIVGSTVGITATYAVAIGLCLAAVVPLLNRPYPLVQRPGSFRQVELNKVWKDFVSNLFNTADDFVQVTAWPLLTFFVIPSYAGVGIISTITVVSAILISAYVGRREGSKGERHFIKEGSYLMAVVSGLRLLVQNALHITGINFLYGASRAMVDTPYNSRYYERAKAGRTLEYICSMQLASAVGWIIIASVLYVLVLLLPDNLALLVALSLVVPASLGIQLMR